MSGTDFDNGTSGTTKSEARLRDVLKNMTSKTEEQKEQNLNVALCTLTSELYDKYSPVNYIPLKQRILQQKNAEISRSKSLSNDIERKAKNSNGTIMKVPKIKNSVAMSSAELYNKYSPANYVPLMQRILQQQNAEISHSKSITRDRQPAVAETILLSKPAVEKKVFIPTKSLAKKLNRLTPFENQLHQKKRTSLRKSTVIEVEGEVNHKKVTNSRKIKLKHSPVDIRNNSGKNLKNKVEKRIKTSKHPSNFASYIQISQPKALRKKKVEIIRTINNKDTTNDEIKNSSVIFKSKEPEQAGIEDKTFEHENILKKSTNIEHRQQHKVKFIKINTELDNIINDFEKKSSSETDCEDKASEYVNIFKNTEKIKEKDQDEIKPMKTNTEQYDILGDIEEESFRGIGFEDKAFENENILKNTEKIKEKDQGAIKSMKTNTEQDEILYDVEENTASGIVIEEETFEHGNILKSTEKIKEKEQDEIKAMETSAMDIIRESTEPSSKESLSTRRTLDQTDYEDLKGFVYTQDVPVVTTTQGLVRGLAAEDGDYHMYLGIPYGKVNLDNPFGPSSPAPAFEGIFNATDDSAECPQTNGFILQGSLDCLHLNVFVPSSAMTSTNLLPVLLFIHGGAFISGSYGRYLYGARFLVRHDIILITFNYRLDVFGYMCTNNERVPGNQAFRDQLLALKWVHDNVENFGGDPNRVTLSGNSAGGMSADLHIISSKTPELFQQVILQSGVSFLPSYPPTLRNSPIILAQHFGFQTTHIDDALDFLSTLDPLQIISAVHQLGLQFRTCIERPFDGVQPFITENWVLKEEIPAAKDMNVMIGFNENEALGLFLLPSSDLSNIVNASLTETFLIDHEDFIGHSEVRHFFFGDGEIDSHMFKEAINLRSDTSFVHNSMRSVKKFLKNDVGKLYLYLFLYDGERNLVKNIIDTTLEGAAHADEVGYLYDISYFGPPSVQDQLTVDRMTEMWANFVKYGDPTPTKTSLLPVKWESITPTSPHHYIHIDDDLETRTSPFNERMAFWDLFLEANEDLQKFVVDSTGL